MLEYKSPSVPVLLIYTIGLNLSLLGVSLHDWMQLGWSFVWVNPSQIRAVLDIFMYFHDGEYVYMGYLCLLSSFPLQTMLQLMVMNDDDDKSAVQHT